MYHLAEIVRDAKRDMDERYEGAHSTWAAYTPLPFLYALSGQISKTMQRKAPDLVKRAAVRTRDQIADTLVTSHQRLHAWRVGTTKRGQLLFYTVKSTVETVPLPAAIAPIRVHVAVPVLNGVEGFVQFVTSEELPELYFVAKNSMTHHVVLRHLVMPPLTAMEGFVRYMVILPSQIVFPSREEIELRTDLFLDVSTSRVQSLVEYLYSATEVLDQHWSMVQWNILGRGPYASLSPARRHDVVRSIQQRIRSIDSRYKLYEFMASIRMHNEMLYTDVRRAFPESSGVPLTAEEIASQPALLQELAQQDEHSFPCWFYRKIEATATIVGFSETGNTSEREGGVSAATTPGDGTSESQSTKAAKWVEFPAHENRRLERHYRLYQRQRLAHPRPHQSAIVLVDEGRYEVNLETMEMNPVYWTPTERIEVRRSMWLYAQRNYGLAPYNPTAARVLEDAFTYYLAYYEEEKNRVLAGQRVSRSKLSGLCSLSIPVDGHLVEFKGPQDIMQYKRLLAGTTPFTSKRRVYRGDPRIRGDPKVLDTWRAAMSANSNDLRSSDDDADIMDEFDHLVLIVHGIGDALKTIDIINVVTLRSIIDCATSLRELHKEALRSAHFETLGGSSDSETSRRPRTEFLPIEWHSKLHIEGLDNAIRDVTLPAIPKLREFANDTVLDVLFFMSPMFHRVILDHVASEMNRVFSLFQSRNKGWESGTRGPTAKRKKVSIIAHSLGSIICFDVLNHQTPRPRRTLKPWLEGDPAEENGTHSDKDGTAGTANDDEDADRYEDDHQEHDGGSDESDDNANGFEALVVDAFRERSRSDSECILRSFGTSHQPRVGSAHRRRRRNPTSSAPQSAPQSVPAAPKHGVVISTKKQASPHIQSQILHSKEKRRRKSQVEKKTRQTHRRRQQRSKTAPRKHRRCSHSTNVQDGVPELGFEVENLFCFGSPVGLFLNVRGQHIDRKFRLPTCKRVFNIYHPYDPVAYRIEPILNPRRAHSKAAIIRTFEGKLRFQYQLRNSFRRMWQRLRFWRRNFETQVEKAVRSIGLVESAPLALTHESGSTPHNAVLSHHVVAAHARPLLTTDREDLENNGDHDVYGRLCQGLPIDYSLQENEIEITNEYLFALTSHVIYWGNRDASLFVAQKMILEPPQDEDDDDEDDDFDFGGGDGTISPAFSAASGDDP